MSETKENSLKNDDVDTLKPPIKNNDPFDEKHEKIIVNTILIISLIGIASFIIGIVWSIKDIFEDDAWGWFTDPDRAIATQLFVIGLILIGLFFLLIFIYVLYKRGIRAFAGSLFKEKPEEELKAGEEYLPAKIITVFGLVSVFVIFIGLIIATVQALTAGDSGNNTGVDFIDAIFGVSGGVSIIIASVALLLVDVLIYGFIYIWLNGQWVVVNKILRINNKVVEKYNVSKNQKIIGQIVFALFVLEIAAIFFGIVWWIIDAIAGNFSETFSNFIFGVQFSFFGLLGSLLFAILVGAMFIYKRGLNLIIVPLFVQKRPVQDRSNTMAKIITVGFLVGIVLITLGLLIWIISVLTQGVSLKDLSGGFALLIYSLMAFIFTSLALIFSFAFHNGYAFTLDKILKIEGAIDDGLDDISNITKK